MDILRIEYYNILLFYKKLLKEKINFKINQYNMGKKCV